MKKREEVLEEIKKLLKHDTRGLTIQELSDKIKVSRITTSMALMKLESQDIIDVRIIGNCKLHYLKEINGGKNKK